MATLFRDIRHIGSLLIRSVAALHLFTSSCYEISQTEGASMLPTLQIHGDFCVVDKSYKNGRGISMGDLVVARKPTQPGSWVCKRITGMPGDVVLLDPSNESIDRLREEYEEAINNGAVKVGEKTIDYGRDAAFENRFKEVKIPKRDIHGNGRDPYDMYIVVPDGHVWVTGDNLSDSVDSRTYSVLPMGLIGGRITIGMYMPNILRFNGEYYRWLANTFTEC
jgi:mitochondrial inner membrane protease subunit 1